MATGAEIVPWRCHICARQFEDMQGGVCRSCSRATCNRCWADRLAFLPGRQKPPLCKGCAGKTDVSSVDKKKSAE
jgi:hypothetical protein